ncbi:hypothetical protein FB107DRAFT_270959 [Schizophyllum commune]
MVLSGQVASAFALACENKYLPSLEIRPRYSKAPFDSALAAILATISSYKYPLEDIYKLLSTNLGTEDTGFLSGYLRDFEIAKSHGIRLICVLVSISLHEEYADLCYVRPEIVDAVLRALTCDVTLATLAQSLDIWRGGRTRPSAAALVASILGALDAKDNGLEKAQELVIKMMGPLLGAAVRASLRYDERLSNPRPALHSEEDLPVFTLRTNRIPAEPVASPLEPTSISHHGDNHPGPSSCGPSRVPAVVRQHERAAAVDLDDASVHSGARRHRDPSGGVNETPEDSVAKRIVDSDKDNDGFEDCEYDDLLVGGEDDGDVELRQHDEVVLESGQPLRKKQRHVSGAQRVQTFKNRTRKGGVGVRNGKKASLVGKASTPSKSIHTSISAAYCYPLSEHAIAFFAQQDLPSSGAAFDAQFGGYVLRYVLIAAMHTSVSRPDTLTAEASAAALDALTTVDMLARVAKDVGLTDSDDEKTHKALLAAIARAAYNRPIDECRAHILAIFSPLVLVALDAVKFIEAPVKSAVEIAARRGLVRRAFRLKEGEVPDSGSTPMDTFFDGAPDKTVEALLKRELLEELELI